MWYGLSMSDTFPAVTRKELSELGSCHAHFTTKKPPLSAMETLYGYKPVQARALFRWAVKELRDGNSQARAAVDSVGEGNAT